MKAKRGQKKPVNLTSLLGKFGRPSCPHCGEKTKIIRKGKDRLACKHCGKTYVNPSARRRAYFPKGGK